MTLKNARYLILSNSSFAFFPAFTSETVKTVIAPKYWARHNVSDGYWASGQNIYEGFLYQDKMGKLFDAKQCRREWEAYKKEGGLDTGRKKYTEREIRTRGKADRALYWVNKIKGRLERPYI